MKTSDIPDEYVLKFLAGRQGRWTMAWDVPFPEGTPEKVAASKMKNLIRRGLSGGCSCGCRGDYEITDKGLALVGLPRSVAYSGY